MSEPVAWARFDEDDDNRLCGVLDFENPPLYVTPLYLHPDPRVAELEAVLRECREALMRIEGASMSMYATRSDMTEHMRDIASAAIAKIDEVLK